MHPLPPIPPILPMSQDIYIGLMSGTSLDGVDGVMVQFAPDGATMQTLATAYQPFDAALQQAAMQLQQPGENEIEREAALAQRLAQVYAACVADLCRQAPDQTVQAIGVHGQTIRHRPELGWTRQTNHPALLAELSGLDVIADFRSRDLAAGGQGAPLVPAFHQAIFGSSVHQRVVVNIGGISNISILRPDGAVSGFDTGPGNVLMDGWIRQHLGHGYDADGAWAASGQVSQALLDRLLQEPYLQLPAPKSTGRDLFHADWLRLQLREFTDLAAVDVQATLCAYTAQTIIMASLAYSPSCDALYVCGGGAYNHHLMQQMRHYLALYGSNAQVHSTAALGVAPECVEALAFAWLARQFCLRLPGNLPAVTGARGLRILGALYPA